LNSIRGKAGCCGCGDRVWLLLNLAALGANQARILLFSFVFRVEKSRLTKLKERNPTPAKRDEIINIATDSD
jgi:hypothetical protein